MSNNKCENFLNTSKMQETRNWVDQLNEDFDLESVASSSVVESSTGSCCEDSDTDIETNSSNFGDTIKTELLGIQEDPSVNDTSMSLRELLNSVNSIQTVGNITVENSTGVHIGNITNINGNIQIVHCCTKKTPRAKSRHISKLAAHNEREERISRDVFLSKTHYKIPKALYSFIPRSSWLAQKSMEEYEFVQEPVEFVVVSHTATESSEKQAANIRIIRDIQCFHIESREWSDIAYNFLIGCDGNIYEGRGWGVLGAHTKGYNAVSLGISFIGTFMRELPSRAALNAFEVLIKRGVSEGHIAEDYKLICHCQCRPTESPGRMLFEEIQKWAHYYNLQDD